MEPRSMAEELNIPLIDLAPLHSKDKESQMKVMQHVARACKEWGFFYITNHGMDPELLCSTAVNARRFFELPKDEKLKCPRQASSSFNGYCEFQGKESFLLSYASPHSELNVWPTVPSNFRNTTEQLMNELHRIANLVEKIVLESLGFSKDELYYGCGSVLQFNYFPCSHPGVNELSLREHQDGNILTLVTQLNETNGLEALKNGRWVQVRPMKNALIVNIGDVLQVWTNNMYKSVLHRVRSAPSDRYSLAYFHQAGYNTLVKPLPRFTMGKPPLYRPFFVHDYYKLRVEKKITIDYYAA